LGSLNLSAAFATLGMAAGVILCIGLGLIAVYASYMVGLAKLKYFYVAHYVDFERLFLGAFGDKLFSDAFIPLITLTVESHCLTEKPAFATLSDNTACALVFSAVSALILFAFAIPPNFAELSILGFIGFGSFIVATGVCISATGVQQGDPTGPAWSAWPQEDFNLSNDFVSIRKSPSPTHSRLLSRRTWMRCTHQKTSPSLYLRWA
jgi:hypothetical protein